MKYLVTGAAGFIGSHVCHRLLDRGEEVVGIDNLNDYYDVSLKESRLQRLQDKANFEFIKIDIAHRDKMEALFQAQQFDVVVNLAAQAGVRYSLVNPHAYIEANILGFLNVLEGCRHTGVKHLVYASSSSVYGANTEQPFAEHHNVDHPVALYAATKKSNELMAHSYASLYNLPSTGLRFFTVYGPWGRPDMALFLFTKKIINDEVIDVFNHGKMIRDFTYIDDIVEGVIRVIDQPAKPDVNWNTDGINPSTSYAPYRVYNIGNNQPTPLMEFITAIETSLGKTAKKNFMSLQDGDVPETHASVDALNQDLNFKPETSIQQGIDKFVAWYLDYYQIKC